MEDVKELLVKAAKYYRNSFVSILVLMEDVKELLITIQLSIEKSMFQSLF